MSSKGVVYPKIKNFNTFDALNEKFTYYETYQNSCNNF